MKKMLLASLLLVFILVFSGCNEAEEDVTIPDLPSTSSEEEAYDLEGVGEIPKESIYEAEEETIPPELAYQPTEGETYDSEGTEVIGIPRPFPGNGVLDYASEEDMAYYSDAPRFSWIEEGIWMKFYFERPVSDVAFVSSPMVGYDVLSFSLGETYHVIGDLPTGKPVFVQTMGIFGTTPAQAIGLTYEDGIRYYIPFIQCQKDGDLLLLKDSAFIFPE